MAQNANSIFRPGANGGMVMLTAQVRRASGKTEPITFRHAEANIAEPRYVGGEVLPGVQRGWQLSTVRKGEPHVSVWLPEMPLAMETGGQT